ncbi:UDP-2,4-diacetamido-2,4,6-trideoxy-beta-L-altropyranose hydrolase [Aeromonas rivuli]|uniref:UDP-2,4-diacetamido-2,4, 6-trideoxy-beta-L-altropyranose hydrolase n=1 Tax=Aeromonas rivuli TaxID=648794 RepID=UPI001CC9F6A6|nr:UDP-2,4-diacetamido-2,4,6-trideoxy-beta-L-altropyranose hydrolase [Aeromonas rivuli]UBO72682.1 UDP-2,4-diacetamido-2,4,6-trideoxy-beta-L-altropyranose hydrolase [Aeromonas rivuli]
MIVFRTDASISLGYGHVMRCLALADAFKKLGKKSVFIFSPNGDALYEEVVRKGHEYRVLTSSPLHSLGESEQDDAYATLSNLSTSTKLVVVDHYQLGMDWEEVITASDISLLAIDDIFRSHCSQFLLDQNVIKSENFYVDYVDNISKECVCFLGPRYALLSESFQHLRDRVKTRSKLEKIIIFFGGTDPDNETEKALLGVLAANKNFKIDVVIGGNNPHRSRLLKLCSSTHSTLHIQTPHMARLMLDADLAIGAGGSASWERCCMGLPALISTQADNQVPIAATLHELGAVINLGMVDNLTATDYRTAVERLDPNLINNMSISAMSITDGNGASYVASSIISTLEKMK